MNAYQVVMAAVDPAKPWKLSEIEFSSPAYITGLALRPRFQTHLDAVYDQRIFVAPRKNITTPKTNHCFVCCSTSRNKSVYSHPARRTEKIRSTNQIRFDCNQ